MSGTGRSNPGLHLCSMPLGTPLVEELEQLDWLAKEVMSAFRSVEVAAAAE